MEVNHLAKAAFASALLLSGTVYAGDPTPAGAEQSPVNITPSVAVKGTDKVGIYYPVNCKVTLTNTKNTGIDYSGGNQNLPQTGLTLASEWASLQGKVSDCATPFITLNSKAYTLKQFHFHVPSEHTLNGVKMPMEVHFFHQDPSPDTSDCPDRKSTRLNSSHT